MARFSAKAKSRFYSNLEKYARSGFGIEKACESMLTQPGLKAAERAVLGGIIDGVNSGQSIAQAMNRSRVKLSAVECEIVSAAEKGGLLEKGLAHLSDYFQRVHQTRRRILRGLAYPLIMAHFAIPLAVFSVVMMSKALPDAEPGDSTQMVLKIVGWVAQGYISVLLLIVFAVWLSRFSKKSPGVDTFLNRIPLIGRARKSLALARFCEVFHIHMLAGMRMSDSLEGAGRAAQSGTIGVAAASGVEIVKAGRPLTEAVFASPAAFPNDFARGIAAAEQAGELDGEVELWARFYNEDAGEAMEQLADWTPRLFYFLVLFFVAGLIIWMGMGYRDLIDGWLNI